MIYSLVFRRYAPFVTFGFGFEGDCRTAASTNYKASARTTGGVSFGPDSVGPGSGTSSGTAWPGLGKNISGALGRKVSVVTSSVTINSKSASLVDFSASTAGANPMIPKAPTIDTFVDFKASFGGKSLDVEGTVRGDDFPNAEVFVVDGFGKAVLLFAYATSGGQNTGPMTRLAGSHSTTILGTFSMSILTGGGGRFL